MIGRFKPKSEFSRNVLTLMTGTTIAQAIPVAISPILTRIYTPEDFGVFALYMSVASILSVMATGRYELAIMLPKKDEDAANIVALSIIISFFVSSIALLIVFIFNAQITNLLGNPEISNWLYFVPITVLLTGIYQSFNYWSNRKKQYKRLATSRIVQSGMTASTNLGMGFGGFGSFGLILGNIFGQGMAMFFLGKIVYEEDRNFLQKVKKLKIVALAKKYIQFPKFDIWASLLSVSSHQLMHILFNFLFSSTTAGYYYLTQRILGLPMAFIASAISDVFREEASKDFKKYGNAINIYKATLKKLLIISFFPSIFLYFFAVDLFVVVFGKEWTIAGEYVQILTPMLFIKFISSPLSFMLYIGEKQKLNLYSQVLFIISIIYSFLVSDDVYEVLNNIAIL
ncbi:MAG: lipopolysaccharide biosynthesis protein, partial [Sulfurovum sp.]|nr:lipopolysaccharide biosynthesis protein [Sulfurovum sp.]